MTPGQGPKIADHIKIYRIEEIDNQFQNDYNLHERKDGLSGAV